MRFDQLSGRRAMAAQSRRKPLLGTPAATQEEWLQRAREVPGLRLEKVRAIREALATGTYDIDAKVQSFLERYPENFPTNPAA